MASTGANAAGFNAADYLLRRHVDAGDGGRTAVVASETLTYAELEDRVAAVAASFGLQISGHCGPHLHAHVAAATPNLRHLEWFHDHVRIESMFFDGTLDPTGGTITPDDGAPGNGLTLRVSDAERYRVA